jgi:chromosome segregation ATPase
MHSNGNTQFRPIKLDCCGTSKIRSPTSETSRSDRPTPSRNCSRSTEETESAWYAQTGEVSDRDRILRLRTALIEELERELVQQRRQAKESAGDKSALARAQKEIADLKAQRNTHEASDFGLRNGAKRRTGEIEDLRSNVRDRAELLELLRQEVDRLRQEVNTLRPLADAVPRLRLNGVKQTNLISSLNRRLDQMNEIVQPLRQQVTDKENEAARVRGVLVGAKRDLRKVEGLEAKATRESTSRAQKVAELEQKATDLRKDIRERKEEIEDLQKDNRVREQEVNDLQDKVGRLEPKLQEIRGANEAKAQRIQQLEADKVRMQQVVDVDHPRVLKELRDLTETAQAHTESISQKDTRIRQLEAQIKAYEVVPKVTADPKAVGRLEKSNRMLKQELENERGRRLEERTRGNRYKGVATTEFAAADALRDEVANLTQRATEQIANLTREANEQIANLTKQVEREKKRADDLKSKPATQTSGESLTRERRRADDLQARVNALETRVQDEKNRADTERNRADEAVQQRTRADGLQQQIDKIEQRAAEQRERDRVVGEQRIVRGSIEQQVPEPFTEYIIPHVVNEVLCALGKDIVTNEENRIRFLRALFVLVQHRHLLRTLESKHRVKQYMQLANDTVAKWKVASAEEAAALIRLAEELRLTWTEEKPQRKGKAAS